MDLELYLSQVALWLLTINSVFLKVLRTEFSLKISVSDLFLDVVSAIFGKGLNL